MKAEPPHFWWTAPQWRSTALLPAAWIYGAVAGARLRKVHIPVATLPVLCVGNYTVGGSGKTPLAIALAATAKTLGHKPGFLTRGHGGTLNAPRLVDPLADTAAMVGDEAMLLARHGPVAAGVDRHAASGLLAEAGCTIAIMDDGFQSRRTAIDYAVLAIDARRGIGNGRIVPAGPLRAPLAQQIGLTDMLVVVGEGQGADKVVRLAARAGKPVVPASLKARKPKGLRNDAVLAFAGNWTDPAKFFDTLSALGVNVKATRAFPDHHPFTDEEIGILLDDAGALGANLITTEKDAVRLGGDSPVRLRLRDALTVLPVKLTTPLDGVFERAIQETVRRFSLR
ncbi:MAG: tetraacyldisaccharide 4'-kinase [Phyllobacteriaceae bacterium]|nr:tetraacyldisaccharide 4'-kinase [Phyllobacteriaceae bacterium]